MFIIGLLAVLGTQAVAVTGHIKKHRGHTHTHTHWAAMAQKTSLLLCSCGKAHGDSPDLKVTLANVEPAKVTRNDLDPKVKSPPVKANSNPGAHVCFICRDIKDRAVLKVYETETSGPMPASPGPGPRSPKVFQDQHPVTYALHGYESDSSTRSAPPASVVPRSPLHHHHPLHPPPSPRAYGPDGPPVSGQNYVQVNISKYKCMSQHLALLSHEFNQFGSLIITEQIDYVSKLYVEFYSDVTLPLTSHSVKPI